ncbi:MAG: cysteine peptidase family C39 domain-containing protein, partial [Candidatus Omnitrophota bacterium]
MISQARTKTGGFKTWIRVVALIVVVIFAPQQIAWAIDYDWHTIWRTQAQSSAAYGAPVMTLPYSALKAAGFEKQIAFNIKESLESLRKSNVQRVQFTDDVVIDKVKIDAIAEEEINEIYKNLVDSRNNIITCGAYSLYNLMLAYGMTSIPTEKKSDATLEGPSILEIANNLILIDLLSDSEFKPKFRANELEVSFYSIIRTAHVYGMDLKAFHLETSEKDLESINKLVSFPFIATIDEPHTVLVRSIDKNGVLIIDNDIEILISKKEFVDRFRSYGLAQEVYSSKDLTLLNGDEAKSIVVSNLDDDYDASAHGYSRSAIPDYYISDLKKSILIGVGASVAGSFIAAGVNMLLSSVLAPAVSTAAGTATTTAASSTTQAVMTGLSIVNKALSNPFVKGVVRKELKDAGWSDDQIIGVTIVANVATSPATYGYFKPGLTFDGAGNVVNTPRQYMAQGGGTYSFVSQIVKDVGWQYGTYKVSQYIDKVNDKDEGKGAMVRAAWRNAAFTVGAQAAYPIYSVTADKAIQYGYKGAQWTAGKIVDGARWIGGQVADGAVWTAGKVASGAQWSAGKVADGAQWTAGKVADGAQWSAGKVASGAQYAAGKAVDGVRSGYSKAFNGSQAEKPKTQTQANQNKAPTTTVKSNTNSNRAGGVSLGMNVQAKRLQDSFLNGLKEKFSGSRPNSSSAPALSWRLGVNRQVAKPSTSGGSGTGSK